MLVIQQQRDEFLKHLDNLHYDHVQSINACMQTIAVSLEQVKGKKEQKQANAIINEIATKFIKARKGQAKTIEAMIAVLEDIWQTQQLLEKLTQKLPQPTQLNNFLPDQLNAFFAYLKQLLKEVNAEQWSNIATALYIHIQKFYTTAEQNAKTLQEKIDIALAYQHMYFQLEELFKKFPQETELKNLLTEKTQQYRQLLEVTLNNSEITPALIQITIGRRTVDPNYLPNQLPSFMPYPSKGENPETFKKKRLGRILALAKYDKENRILTLNKSQQTEMLLKINDFLQTEINKDNNFFEKLNYKNSSKETLSTVEKEKIVNQLTEQLLQQIKSYEDYPLNVKFHDPQKSEPNWPILKTTVANEIRARIYFDSKEREKRQVFYANGHLFKIDPDTLKTTPYSTKNETAKGKKGEALFVIDCLGRMHITSHYSHEFNGFEVNELVFHSSIMTGAPVFSAGLISTDENGRITMIKNHSGHYKPDLKNLYHTLKFLLEKGLDLSQTEIHYFDGRKTYAFKGITTFAILVGLPELLIDPQQIPTTTDLAQYISKNPELLNILNEKEEPPIIAFAKANRWDIVEQLIALGADKTVLDTDKNNLIHIAASLKKWDIVKKLAQQYSLDIDAVNTKEESIYTVANAQNIDLIKLFSDDKSTNEAESNSKLTKYLKKAVTSESTLQQQISKLETIFEKINQNDSKQSILALTEYNSSQILEKLRIEIETLIATLDKKFILTEEQFEYLEKTLNPLQEIYKFSTKNLPPDLSNEYLKNLKSIMSDKVNQLKQDTFPNLVNKYPINYILYRLISIAQYIQEWQNYTERQLKENKINITAIAHAIPTKDPTKWDRIIQLLAKNINPYAKDRDDKTIIILAAEGNQWNVVTHLLKHYSFSITDIVHAINNKNITWDNIIQLLEKGINPHAKDNEDNTILHLAAKQGKWDIVEALLKEKKYDFAIYDKNAKGESVLSIAQQSQDNQSGIVKALKATQLEAKIKQVDNFLEHRLDPATRYSNLYKSIADGLKLLQQLNKKGITKAEFLEKINKSLIVELLENELEALPILLKKISYLPKKQLEQLVKINQNLDPYFQNEVSNVWPLKEESTSEIMALLDEEAKTKLQGKLPHLFAPRELVIYFQQLHYFHQLFKQWQLAAKLHADAGIFTTQTEDTAKNTNYQAVTSKEEVERHLKSEDTYAAMPTRAPTESEKDYATTPPIQETENSIQSETNLMNSESAYADTVSSPEEINNDDDTKEEKEYDLLLEDPENLENENQEDNTISSENEHVNTALEEPHDESSNKNIEAKKDESPYEKMPARNTTILKSETEITQSTQEESEYASLLKVSENNIPPVIEQRNTNQPSEKISNNQATRERIIRSPSALKEHGPTTMPNTGKKQQIKNLQTYIDSEFNKNISALNKQLHTQNNMIKFDINTLHGDINTTKESGFFGRLNRKQRNLLESSYRKIEAYTNSIKTVEKSLEKSKQELRRINNRLLYGSNKTTVGSTIINDYEIDTASENNNDIRNKRNQALQTTRELQIKIEENTKKLTQLKNQFDEFKAWVSENSSSSTKQTEKTIAEISKNLLDYEKQYDQFKRKSDNKQTDYKLYTEINTLIGNLQTLLHKIANLQKQIDDESLKKKLENLAKYSTLLKQLEELQMQVSDQRVHQQQQHNEEQRQAEAQPAFEKRTSELSISSISQDNNLLHSEAPSELKIEVPAPVQRNFISTSNNNNEIRSKNLSQFQTTERRPLIQSENFIGRERSNVLTASDGRQLNPNTPGRILAYSVTNTSVSADLKHHSSSTKDKTIADMALTASQQFPDQQKLTVTGRPKEVERAAADLARLGIEAVDTQGNPIQFNKRRASDAAKQYLEPGEEAPSPSSSIRDKMRTLTSLVRSN